MTDAGKVIFDNGTVADICEVRFLGGRLEVVIHAAAGIATATHLRVVGPDGGHVMDTTVTYDLAALRAIAAGDPDAHIVFPIELVDVIPTPK